MQFGLLIWVLYSLLGYCLAHTGEYVFAINQINSSFPIPLASIHITDNETTIDPSNLVSEPLEDVCLSFFHARQETPQFKCFNYFENSNVASKNGELIGELRLFMDHSWIDSVSFISTDSPLKITFSNINELHDPQPRLQVPTTELSSKDKSFSNAKDVMTKETSENFEVEGKQEDDKSLKKPKLIDGDVDVDGVEFEEVVKPSNFYKDNQTFIERNWKFILGPIVVIIIIGNLFGPRN